MLRPFVLRENIMHSCSIRSIGEIRGRLSAALLAVAIVLYAGACAHAQNAPLATPYISRMSPLAAHAAAARAAQSHLKNIAADRLKGNSGVNPNDVSLNNEPGTNSLVQTDDYSLGTYGGYQGISARTPTAFAANAVGALLPTNVDSVWSPDESFIIFASNRKSASDPTPQTIYQLYAIDAQGDAGSLKQLTFGTVSARYPAFVGTSINNIVFAQAEATTTGAYDLYQASLSTTGGYSLSNAQEVPTPYGLDGNGVQLYLSVQHPTASSAAVVFAGNPIDNTTHRPYGLRHLYSVALSGGGQVTEMTFDNGGTPTLSDVNGTEELDPAYSPDGNFIAFDSTALNYTIPTPSVPYFFSTGLSIDASNYVYRNIFVMNVNGTLYSELTAPSAGNGKVDQSSIQPCWSSNQYNQFLNPNSDRQYIFFSRNANVSNASSVYQIWYLRADESTGAALSAGNAIEDVETANLLGYGPNSATLVDTSDVVSGDEYDASSTQFNLSAIWPTQHNHFQPSVSKMQSYPMVVYSSERYLSNNSTDNPINGIGQTRINSFTSERLDNLPDDYATAPANSSLTTVVSPAEGEEPAATSEGNDLELCVSRLFSTDPPSLLRYDESTSEIFRIESTTAQGSATKYVSPGSPVTVVARLSDREAGIGSFANTPGAQSGVWLQLKDPDSKYQDAAGLEHKVFTHDNPVLGNNWQRSPTNDNAGSEFNWFTGAAEDEAAKFGTEFLGAAPYSAYEGGAGQGTYPIQMACSFTTTLGNPPTTTIAAAALVGATTVVVANAANIVGGSVIIIKSNPFQQETVQGVAGTTLTITPALTVALAGGEVVVKPPAFNPAGQDTTISGTANAGATTITVLGSVFSPGDTIYFYTAGGAIIGAASPALITSVIDNAAATPPTQTLTLEDPLGGGPGTVYSGFPGAAGQTPCIIEQTETRTFDWTGNEIDCQALNIGNLILPASSGTYTGSGVSDAAQPTDLSGFDSTSPYNYATPKYSPVVDTSGNWQAYRVTSAPAKNGIYPPLRYWIPMYPLQASISAGVIAGNAGTFTVNSITGFQPKDVCIIDNGTGTFDYVTVTGTTYTPPAGAVPGSATITVNCPSGFHFAYAAGSTLYEKQSIGGGVLYMATIDTPSTPSDYYLDLIAYDNSKFPVQYDTGTNYSAYNAGTGVITQKAVNWAIYDNISGFTTASFTPTNTILIVNDYALPQKFFTGRFGSGIKNYPPMVFGAESYLTDIETTFNDQTYTNLPYKDPIDGSGPWTDNYGITITMKPPASLPDYGVMVPAPSWSVDAAPVPVVAPLLDTDNSVVNTGFPSNGFYNTSLIADDLFQPAYCNGLGVDSYVDETTNATGLNNVPGGNHMNGLIYSVSRNAPPSVGGPGVSSLTYDEVISSNSGFAAPSFEVNSQKYDIWRILSRGPIPTTTLSSYAPNVVAEPAATGTITGAGGTISPASTAGTPVFVFSNGAAAAVNSDGSFTLPGVPVPIGGGKVTLYAYATGYTPQSEQIGGLTFGASVAATPLTLPSGVPGVGTITGAPGSITNASASGPQFSVFADGATASVNSDGSFTLSNVPAGNVTLYAYATNGGYVAVSEPVTVPAGGSVAAPAVLTLSAGNNVLVAPSCVIWCSPYTGDEFVENGTLADQSVQTQLVDFLQTGGRLFVEGIDVGYALTSGGNVGNTLYNTYLNAQYGADTSAGALANFTVAAAGTADDLVSNDAFINFNNGHSAFSRQAILGSGGYEAPWNFPTVISSLFNTVQGNTGFDNWADGSLNAYSFDNVNQLNFINCFSPILPASQELIGAPPSAAGSGNAQFIFTGDPLAGYLGNSTSASNAWITAYSSFGLETISQNAQMVAASAHPSEYVVCNLRTDYLHNLVCMMRTARINGHVSNSATGGQPMAGATVSALLSPGVAAGPNDGRSSANQYYTAVTDSSGNYTIYGLPAGQYNVQASMQIGTSNTYLHSAVNQTEVHGGLYQTVNLQINAPTVNVQVHVTDSSTGGAVKNAIVKLYASTDTSEGNLLYTGTSNAAGLATVSGVNPGEYIMNVSLTTAPPTYETFDSFSSTYTPVSGGTVYNNPVYFNITPSGYQIVAGIPAETTPYAALPIPAPLTPIVNPLTFQLVDSITGVAIPYTAGYTLTINADQLSPDGTTAGLTKAYPDPPGLPAGTYPISVAPPANYVPIASENVTLAKNQWTLNGASGSYPVKVPVTQTQTGLITIADGPTGKALIDATVTVTPPVGPAVQFTYSAISGGYVGTVTQTAGTYTVNISDNGYLTDTETFTWPVGSNPFPVQYLLAPSQVAGQITSSIAPATGISGAAVALTGNGTTLNTATDSNGFYGMASPYLLQSTPTQRLTAAGTYTITGTDNPNYQANTTTVTIVAGTSVGGYSGTLTNQVSTPVENPVGAGAGILELTPTPQAVTIVVDDSVFTPTTALIDASVTLTDPSGTNYTLAYSAGAGGYTNNAVSILPASLGTYSLTISDTGYLTDSETFNMSVGSAYKNTYKIIPVEIDGQVINFYNSLPINGVTVSITNSAGFNPVTTTATTIYPSGGFQFRSQPAPAAARLALGSAYTLAAVEAGVYVSNSATVTIFSGTSIAGVAGTYASSQAANTPDNINYPNPTPIPLTPTTPPDLITVADGPTGTPLTDATVSVTPPGGSATPFAYNAVLGGYAGTVPQNVAGTYTVTISDSGYLTDTETFTWPGSGSPFPVAYLLAPSEISGQVTSTIAPTTGLAGVTVSVNGIAPVLSATTDANGYYTISTAPSATQRLVAAQQYTLTGSDLPNYQNGTTTVTITAGTSPKGYSNTGNYTGQVSTPVANPLELTPTPQTVTVIVNDSPSGTPLTDATLVLTDPTNKIYTLPYSAVAGGYTNASVGIVPGTYSLSISDAGYLTDSESFQMAVGFGYTPTYNVIPVEIDGQVTDSLTGQPINGVTVSVSNDAGIASVVSAGAGNFQFRSQPAPATTRIQLGTGYTITAVQPGLYVSGTASVTITTGANATSIGGVANTYNLASPPVGVTNPIPDNVNYPTPTPIPLTPTAQTMTLFVDDGPTGTPLIDATVNVTYPGGGAPVPLPYNKALGAYVGMVTQIKNATYTVTISDKGYLTDTETFTESVGTPYSNTFKLAPSQVKGQVTTAFAPTTGLAGATVSVNGFVQAPATTDGNGDYTISSGPAGTDRLVAGQQFTINASAINYISNKTTVSIKAGTSPNGYGSPGTYTNQVNTPLSNPIVLAASQQSVSVTVSDGPSGAALTDATVTLKDPMGGSYTLLYNVVSGYTNLAVSVYPGKYTLTIADQGYLTDTETFTMVAGVGYTNGYLLAPSEIQGQVTTTVAPATGLAGATVSVNGFTPVLQSPATTATGIYTIASTPTQRLVTATQYTITGNDSPDYLSNTTTVTIVAGTSVGGYHGALANQINVPVLNPLELTPTPEAVTIVVEDGPSTNQLVDATVTLVDPNGVTYTLGYNGVSGYTNTSVSIIPGKPYTLTIADAGYLTDTETFQMSIGNQYTNTYLLAPNEIQGEITSSIAPAVGLAGATVSVNGIVPVLSSPKTGASGIYTIASSTTQRLVATNQYTLTGADSPNYLNNTATVTIVSGTSIGGYKGGKLTKQISIPNPNPLPLTPTPQAVTIIVNDSIFTPLTALTDATVTLVDPKKTSYTLMYGATPPGYTNPAVSIFPGTYTLTIVDPGYLTDTETFTMSVGNAYNSTYKIIPVEIDGQVSDAVSLKPVDGATVAITGSGFGDVTSGSTTGLSSSGFSAGGYLFRSNPLSSTSRLLLGTTYTITASEAGKYVSNTASVTIDNGTSTSGKAGAYVPKYVPVGVKTPIADNINYPDPTPIPLTPIVYGTLYGLVNCADTYYDLATHGVPGANVVVSGTDAEGNPFTKSTTTAATQTGVLGTDGAAMNWAIKGLPTSFVGGVQTPYTVTVTDAVYPNSPVTASASFASGATYGRQNLTLQSILEQKKLPEFSTGLQMLAVPYDFTDNLSLSDRFGAGFGGTNVPGQIIAWYDGFSQSWVEPTTLTRGQAFWVNFRNIDSASFNGIGLLGVYTPSASEPTPANIALYPGWNMIGSPWDAAKSASKFTVVDSAGTDHTWADATSALGSNLIDAKFYSYPAGSSAYTQITMDATGTLQPWVGYWVYAYSYCNVEIPNP